MKFEHFLGGRSTEPQQTSMARSNAALPRVNALNCFVDF